MLWVQFVPVIAYIWFCVIRTLLCIWSCVNMTPHLIVACVLTVLCIWFCVISTKPCIWLCVNKTQRFIVACVFTVLYNWFCVNWPTNLTCFDLRGQARSWQGTRRPMRRCEPSLPRQRSPWRCLPGWPFTLMTRLTWNHSSSGLCVLCYRSTPL